jgi:hypothetical protein
MRGHPNSELGTVRAVLAAASLALAVLLAPGAQADDKKDASVEDLKVEYDLHPAQQKLYTMLAKYVNDPNIVGTGCKRSALQVAINALFRYDIDVHFRTLMKQMAEGVRDGAKLGGAKTLSKVAEYAGQIVAAYDMDQPEAAIGQAIVNDSIDWAVEKAKVKSGDNTVDEAAKDAGKKAGEKAKEVLNKALFGGDLAKRITEDCSTWPAPCGKASVTVEFQKPQNGKRGGLFVLVRGECDCKAKSNESKLREYQISFFAPLAGMDARIEWGSWLKTAIDIKGLVEASTALKKSVQDAIKNDPDTKEPPSAEDLQKLVDDVTKKAGTTSSLKPTLILTPRFDAPSLDDISITAKCGCEEVKETTPAPAPATTPAPQPGGGGPAAPPPAENACPECKAAGEAWQSAEKTLYALEGRLGGAELRVKQDEATLKAREQDLKDIDSNPQFKNNVMPGLKKQQMREAAAKIETANTALKESQAALEKLKTDIATAQTEVDKTAKALDECAKTCKKKSGGSHKKKTPKHGRKATLSEDNPLYMENGHRPANNVTHEKKPDDESGASPPPPDQSDQENQRAPNPLDNPGTTPP